LYKPTKKVTSGATALIIKTIAENAEVIPGSTTKNIIAVISVRKMLRRSVFIFIFFL